MLRSQESPHLPVAHAVQSDAMAVTLVMSGFFEQHRIVLGAGINVMGVIVTKVCGGAAKAT
jgi:hypothetical protein